MYAESLDILNAANFLVSDFFPTLPQIITFFYMCTRSPKCVNWGFCGTMCPPKTCVELHKHYSLMNFSQKLLTGIKWLTVSSLNFSQSSWLALTVLKWELVYRYSSYELYTIALDWHNLKGLWTHRSADQPSTQMSCERVSDSLKYNFEF